MKKTATVLILVLILEMVVSIPVRCAQNAYALEFVDETETLGDPCGGRVCQSKCSCGKYVYFNLDNMLSSNITASEVYRSICVTDSVNSKKLSTFRGLGKKKPSGDYGFVYDDLKKSLSACGFRYNGQGFGRLFRQCEDASYKKIRGRRGARIANAAYFLCAFALKLKDFAKVCGHRSNWKQTLQSKLNSKLYQAKRAHNFDLKTKKLHVC
eukprot:gene8202-30_t